MAEFYICRECRKILASPDDAIFVKAKGCKDLRWYCKDCTKGGGKDDPAGKRNRAEAHRPG